MILMKGDTPQQEASLRRPRYFPLLQTNPLTTLLRIVIFILTGAHLLIGILAVITQVLTLRKRHIVHIAVRIDIILPVHIMGKLLIIMYMIMGMVSITMPMIEFINKIHLFQ